MDQLTFRLVAGFYKFLSKIPLTRRIAAKHFSMFCNKISFAPSIRSTLAGIPVTLNLSIGSDRTIYLLGACDLRGVRAMQRVMERLKPRIAWDVGANRGNHAAFMRPFCERLFCFEPNPVEAQRLVELFEHDSNVNILDIGLSDETGNRPFWIDRQESGNSTFEVIASKSNANLSVKTGDEVARLFGITGIDFIKMDVEGHERAVLSGMSGIISAQRPIIIFEILEAQSKPEFGFGNLLPDYTIYGNTTSFISGITMGAYKFCKFEYGKTYMSAIAIPNERRDTMSGIIPN